MNLWQLKTSNGMKYVTDINKVDAKEYLSAKKIEFICLECGERLGKRPKGDLITTITVDNCDICGKVRGLCHVRHYNYLRK